MSRLGLEVAAVYKTCLVCLMVAMVITEVNTELHRTKKDEILGSLSSHSLRGMSSHEIWRKTKMSMECERRVLTLSCPAGRTITVIKASYGRKNRDVCPDPYMPSTMMLVNCFNLVTNPVATACNDLSSCSVEVLNGQFGDPCPNTYKYLEVYYGCVSAFGKK